MCRPFVLACAARTEPLPDLKFFVRIRNRIPVSGPKPNIHFTSDNAYIIEDDLALSGNCLIDPGTPFTVHPGKKIRLLAGSALTAMATEEQPICFYRSTKSPISRLSRRRRTAPSPGCSTA